MQAYSGLRISQMKRSVRISVSLQLTLDPDSPSQRANCERSSKIGSLPWIPQRTIISHARLTTREPHPGFFKAVYSKSGSGLLLSYGSMANVRSFPVLLLGGPLTPVL